MAISVTSFGNTPQAGDDLFLSGATGLTEDSTETVWLSVMLNDSGGAAKTLYSLDDGLSGGTTLRPADLLVQDTARSEALSTDTSLGGARIWITADGRVGYDSGTLSVAFTQQLQALNAGECLYDSFTYAIRLGNGTLSWATATLQFAGANDAPVVTGAVIGNAVEDGAALTLDALANASDVDAGAVLSVVDVPATLPPGVSYDAATHSFSIDPGHAAYQHLGAGVILPVSVVYGVSDGTAITSAAVTFTVSGTNDVAVIGDPAASEVTEDADVSAGALQASGVLSISDVDTGEAAFQTTVAGDAGNLGGLDMAADGSYTYSVANAAVQGLGGGDTHVDTFTVTSLDGTTREIAFTVHGVNDAAVIGDPTDALVTEDADVVAGNLGATGSIPISDVDQGQASFRTSVIAAAGALGSLALASDGSYTYSVANADVQSLGATDTQVDTFTISALDGTTKDISFTIQGANDVALISGVASASVQEDTSVVGGQLLAGGLLSVADLDAGESGFLDQGAIAGTYGSFTLDADGTWTYAVANNLAAVQALDTGASLEDSFTAHSFDGSASQLVTVTIHGLDDVTVLPGTTGPTTYGFAATGSGTYMINDPGGTDLIQVTGNNAVLSALNFEKVGNDLQIQIGGQDITVQNHFAGNAVEDISFAAGQTYAGYALAGSYNIYSGSGFGGVNGNSPDVVAGTSGGESLDGGGAGNSSGRDLLFGNAGNDTLVGRADGDLLVAGAGLDNLQGGDGNDVLVGGADNDLLTGGAGNDFFVLMSAPDAGVDRITDFNAQSADVIWLSGFGLSTPGSAAGTTLQASEFLSGGSLASATVGAGVHVLFDTATGNLYYDANGGGADQRTLIGGLDANPTLASLDASDFKVGL